MKNSQLNISENWEIKKDEFLEIDPFDDTIDDQIKFGDLFIREDLLLIEKRDFNIDLGWYGLDNKGHFILYLFKGYDWHNCQLLEKRLINDYQLIIKYLNEFVKNVDSGRYDLIKTKFGAIDDYLEVEYLSVFNK